MINSNYCQKRIVSLHLNEGLLLAVVVWFWDWAGARCCVLGACAALGRSGRLLGYWAFAFSLSRMTASVASHGDGPRGLGVVASVFARVLRFGVGYLGGHLSRWGWWWLFPFLLFYFGALWFEFGLSFDWSFPLRVLFRHNCIFVSHIFNKLMKNKAKKIITFKKNEMTNIW